MYIGSLYFQPEWCHSDREAHEKNTKRKHAPQKGRTGISSSWWKKKKKNKSVWGRISVYEIFRFFPSFFSLLGFIIPLLSGSRFFVIMMYLYIYTYIYVCGVSALFFSTRISILVMDIITVWISDVNIKRMWYSRRKRCLLPGVWFTAQYTEHVLCVFGHAAYYARTPAPKEQNRSYNSDFLFCALSQSGCRCIRAANKIVFVLGAFALSRTFHPLQARPKTNHGVETPRTPPLVFSRRPSPST